ncbi:MAG: TIGR00730 family Rossman fold protein [Ruminococcaceae bacterium]|nr:TIGR00730 family Rossman fold protein [Oscillospiraceae bacterium]
MKICVFGAASPKIDQEYIDKVELLGEEMVKRGHSLVFGGGANGLMGAVARGVQSQGGRIEGIIPSFFENEEIEAVFEYCDEVFETATMRERKQIMEDRSDAFVIVPGGIGTFEEFFEIMTLRQLCRHNKPIALFNIKGYYNELNAMMQAAVEKGFVRSAVDALYKTTDDMEELFAFLEAPQPENLLVKDLKDG